MSTVLALKKIIYKLIVKPLKGEKVKAEASLSESEFYEQLFTKNAEWSSAVPNKEESLRWQHIKEMVELIKDTNHRELSILDVGCGRGWLTNLLNNFGVARGIEPVRSVVDHGKKLFPHLNLKSCYTYNLISDEPDAKFDLVVSSEVIEHIPDDSKKNFVSDISRLLNEGGYVIISTPRAEAQEVFLKYASANQPIEEWISEAYLENLFTSNGYITVKKALINCEVPYSKEKTDLYQVWCFKKAIIL